MKTHLLILGTAALLGTSFVATSYAVDPSEYLHLTRHRDSNGNLLMAPTMPQAESSVMKKMVMPSQLKSFERRSTDWGMSEEAVIANEPVQSKWSLQAPVLAEHEKRIAYHTQIEGIEADLTYTFYDNQLGQAKYVFEPKHDDAMDYVQDFHTVEHWITHSYGPPLSVQEIWLDPLYQYDSSLWGLAIKRRHLVMVAEWKNPGTDIVLVLDGGNDEVGLVADFSSTTFVIPVIFDLEGQDNNVKSTVEERTGHEADSTEQSEGVMAHKVPTENISPQSAVASQGSVHTMQGISNGFNKEFPVREPVNKEFPVQEPVNREFPLTSSAEPAMESDWDNGMVDVAHQEAGIEAVSPAQASVKKPFPVSEAINKEFPVQESVNKKFPLSEEISSLEIKAQSPPKDELAHGTVMEVDAELDPLHL